MTNEGVYYSKLKTDYRFMWAFIKEGKEHPAHFGKNTIENVIENYYTPTTYWNFSPEQIKYLVLPEGMLKWKDQ